MTDENRKYIQELCLILKETAAQERAKRVQEHPHEQQYINAIAKEIKDELHWPVEVSDLIIEVGPNKRVVVELTPTHFLITDRNDLNSGACYIAKTEFLFEHIFYNIEKALR